ncbi:hypothetical protein SAMN04488096_101549 [Mesonia phycicola]|uniref:DUF456 domain-containing protein n=1 Tax=Mesonia phycicola TaxID=579105 RepID=A0A1M6B1F6_9FLAO|nr:DUF456 domain-containing protein [Mesonia phycicola]SHI42536.1 hypothetical protein SAMN04488096_101549 [Mesonia phycicola]
MDIILIVLGFILCIVGIVGSVLPILPGPPISWLGLLLLYFVDGMKWNYWLLGATFFIAILIFILDYIIPAAGTKKYGGSKAGAIGTTVGLIVGIFIPIPLGFLIGPFVGAFIGEFIFNKSSSKIALRAAFGSFMGFLASTFMKLFVAIIYLGLFIYLCIEHQEILF